MPMGDDTLQQHVFADKPQGGFIGRKSLPEAKYKGQCGGARSTGADSPRRLAVERRAHVY